MMLGGFVESRIHDFTRNAFLYIRNLFGSLVDKQGYKVRFRVVFPERVRYFLQKRGFARFRRSDDKTSLPLSDRTEYIHTPYREVVLGVLSFEYEFFVGVSRRQFVELRSYGFDDVHYVFAVYRIDEFQRRRARIPHFRAGADDVIALSQSVLFDERSRHEYVFTRTLVIFRS